MAPILGFVVAKKRHLAGVPGAKVVILRVNMRIFSDVPAEVLKILTAIGRAV